MYAADKSKEKVIVFETAIRNSFGIIIISNSCDEPPKSLDNHLITTKKDKGLHGFGIRSVRNALKKYDGDMNWMYDSEEHQFTTTAMLDKQNINSEMRAHIEI